MLGFCYFLVWNDPTNIAVSDFTGYDIRFEVPGEPDMIISRGRSKRFYFIQPTLPRAIRNQHQRGVMVQVG